MNKTEAQLIAEDLERENNYFNAQRIKHGHPFPPVIPDEEDLK